MEEHAPMRRLIVNEFVTLDGVMQGPGSPDEDREGGFEHGGWQMPYFDEVQMEAVSKGIESSGGYLLGRKTYDIFASYWPDQPDDDPFARTLNGRPKWVVSRTLSEPLAWKGSTLIRDDVGDEIRKLKAQDGGDISVLGSGELVQTLARENLVDQYWIMVCPVVLGSGKRLFREGFPFGKLRLVDATPNTKGAVMLTYEPMEDASS